MPSEGDGYRIVARDLLAGLEALSTLSNISPRAAALLAGHTLECVLKAFLWHEGKLGKLAKRDKHNLLHLWKMAFDANLGISQTPPAWCATLAVGHGPNFYFRYQEGMWDEKKKRKTIVHGGQMPALIPMTVELKRMFEMVERTVKG